MDSIIEKRITGDWFDIKEASDNALKLAEYFVLTDADLDSMTSAIKFSVEDGLVEFKRKAVSGLFVFAENQRYDSRSFDEIVGHIRAMREVIYVTLMQRLVVQGTVPPRKVRSEAKIDGSFVSRGVKEIVEDVQARIAKDPELKRNSAVKNLLMQVNIYRKELTDLKELAPNMPKEKLAAFKENFRKSLETITKKIQDYYAALLSEVEVDMQPTASANIFRKYDLKPFAALYLNQAKEFAAVNSILSYAEKERYKTREILSGVPARKEHTVGLVARELREYERVAPEHGKDLARDFGWEMIYVLNRQREKQPVDEPMI